MESFMPIFVGFIVGVGIYAIITASKENPKVKRVLLIIELIIAVAIAIIIIFFLINALINK
jgi:ABC-type antimicrobial peptide transport system permease subunit